MSNAISMSSSVKQSIPSIDINEYAYDLPSDRIAAFPLDERDASKLLRFDATTGYVEHRHFYDLPNLLPAGSLLVTNSTRVIAARLIVEKPTGGSVEVLLVDPLTPSKDPTITLLAKGRSSWACMIGGRNVVPGMVLSHRATGLEIYVLERNGTGAVVELVWNHGGTLGEILQQIGRIPLPPYLQREVEEVDAERYQTVYAQEQGSVAAPTAGLHFTNAVFEQIAARNINTAQLTLHVGMGTFQPVTAVDARDHAMHAERFGVTRTCIEVLARQANNPSAWITAVGTTSLRTLESLVVLGSLLCKGAKPDPKQIHVDQWMAFDKQLWDVTRMQAWDAILAWMDSQRLSSLWGQTSIMLSPGCRIASVDALVTNFHQPGNTLMLLVAAFVGNHRWRELYDAALQHDYRFLSYGDSSLLIRDQNKI